MLVVEAVLVGMYAYAFEKVPASRIAVGTFASVAIASAMFPVRATYRVVLSTTPMLPDVTISELDIHRT